MSKLDEFNEKRDQLDVLQRQVIDLSFELGMDQDFALLKRKHEESIKYAQESYEFLKVARTRINLLSDNKLEHVTKYYLNEAISQLEKITDINK